MNEELAHRAQTNRLIFSNICNGIRPDRVKEAFQLSDLELKQRTGLIMRKINERCWRKLTNGKPGGRRPFVCADYREMYNDGRALLAILDQMPDGLLASPVDMPQIVTQNVDDLVLADVAHKMANSHVAAHA